MLGVVFWSLSGLGLSLLLMWGICSWNDTSGRGMEQLRVLEEGCRDKDNYSSISPPPQHAQGSSLSLRKGKRLMFKDQ